MLQRSLISPAPASTSSTGTSRPSALRCLGSMTRCVTVLVAGLRMARTTSPQTPSEQLALAPRVNSVAMGSMITPGPVVVIPRRG